MKKEIALIYTSYPEKYQKKLNAAFQNADFQVSWVNPQGENAKQKAMDDLHHATVAILGNALPMTAILDAPKLRWLHYDWVGIESGISVRLFEKGVQVTNGSGRNSICLAEHVFYFMFTLDYGTREIFAAQNVHHWGVNHSNPYTSLYGKMLLTVGTGSIAREVAKRAKAFEMQTIGFCRSKKSLENYDKVYSVEDGDSLDDLLPLADYVVLAVPLNTTSYHLIDYNRLLKMKPTAYLINICRGAVVDNGDLFRALQEHVIAGAGCDTFEQEPLPKDSPLWNLENLVITPHSTPQSPLKFEIGITNIISNISNYLEDRKMVNQQTIQDVLFTS